MRNKEKYELARNTCGVCVLASERTSWGRRVIARGQDVSVRIPDKRERCGV